MSIQPRYKHFSKNFLPINVIPATKILKFHRSKWKKVQKALLIEESKRLKKKSFIFKNNSVLLGKIKRWDRYRFVYRSLLNLKKQIQNFFNNSITNKYLKNIYLKQNYVLKNLKHTAFLKTEYKLDIILWRLNFYSNCFFAKQALKLDKVNINGVSTKFPKFLYSGDIIEIPQLQTLTFSKKKQFLSFFYTFLEVDYYTNTAVVIKDINSLTSKDLLLLLQITLNELDLQEYLLK
jgi:ribosomal protein S4